MFGCSWAYGDELLDPTVNLSSDEFSYETAHTPYRYAHCFGGLIAAHYGAKLTNFGICGGSNLSSQWEFLRWLDTAYNSSKSYLVINALTEPERTSWFDANGVNDNYKHSICIAGKHDDETVHTVKWEEHFKHYLVNSSSRLSRRVTYMQSLELFHGACATRQIDLVQFNVWTLLDKLSSYPSSLLWPEHDMRTIIRPPMLAPREHPNEEGHRYIANMLIPEIERLYS